MGTIPIVIISLLSLYIIMVLIALFTLEKAEIEMFEGKPRYVFSKEGWYGETEYWDRKEEEFVMM